MVTELIVELVCQVSCGLQIIKIKSFLVAGCDEFMTTISLDNRVAASKASKRRALEHTWQSGPVRAIAEAVTRG